MFVGLNELGDGRASNSLDHITVNEEDRAPRCAGRVGRPPPPAGLKGEESSELRVAGRGASAPSVSCVRGRAPA